IPDAELGRLAAAGFDWIWLLSVWQTGEAGGRISRANRAWRREFEATLPDLSEADIAGSGFAITGYEVPAALGGDAALARLRERLRRHGLRLMLDFVPNHTALDHRWVEEHPDYYVAGSERDLARAPDTYAKVAGRDGERILAHGRDPNFPGWADTLQLDYGNPALQAAMRRELLKVARQCDGLRCDMAMLLLPEVFARSWGIAAAPFWPQAIAETRREVPGFCLMAEVYWDLEATMLNQGFDYAYDKRLYDRLVAGEARPVREHLRAEPGYQRKLARFLENHDEPRAAAVFPPGRHEAAATITYLLPGLRFFHQGQLEGRRLHVSPHLVRAPSEPVDETLRQFYRALLAALREPALRSGEWRLLDCTPAWDGNGSWDGCLAWCWEASGGQRVLVAVNYAGHQSQCYVRLPWPDLAGRAAQLGDLLSAARYERDGSDLTARGLYLDLPPWGRHAFAITAQTARSGGA
ncbi:MAG TPA: alpha-amylase family glycosyl hydrolase, partial [Stellaceae bacterium]|nr:alpha-amylase family glycosyl hydrolase [Stellaceae bacterium]